MGDDDKKEFCVTAIYIDTKMVWAGRCNSTAVFEAEKSCQVGVLIYDVCVGYPYPYHQDIVITGIVSPGKIYEITHTGLALHITEVETD